MAEKIVAVKLCNFKTGRIQSDAFVLLDLLVTINEQKRVQEAVYKKLGLPNPNQTRSQPILEQVCIFPLLDKCFLFISWI